PLINGQIPYVVRNGTDKPVFQVIVRAEIRSAAGDLIGAAETDWVYETKPEALNPGDIGIGYVLVNGEYPADAVYSFTTSYSDTGVKSSVDFEISEASWVTDHVVGKITNPSESAVEIIILNLVCLDQGGVPIEFAWNALEGQVPSGGSIVFQFEPFKFTHSAPCERFLVAGNAFIVD
ncbi:MAG: hypothetical protein ACRDHN_19830, partial [Thermomicrobiales bacterium]